MTKQMGRCQIEEVSTKFALAPPLFIFVGTYFARHVTVSSSSGVSVNPYPRFSAGPLIYIIASPNTFLSPKNDPSKNDPSKKSTKKTLAFFPIFGGVLRTAAKNRPICLRKTGKQRTETVEKPDGRCQKKSRKYSEYSLQLCVSCGPSLLVVLLRMSCCPTTNRYDR